MLCYKEEFFGGADLLDCAKANFRGLHGFRCYRHVLCRV